MFVSRLVVRNFRNFESLDVPFSPGTTCVLGENNSGKSNLLHAIRLALDSNLSARDRSLTAHDIHQSQDLSHPLQVVVAVEFHGYENNVAELALVGTWEVRPGVARLTYRFRPRPEVAEAIDRDERPGDGLTIEDYHWELCGGGVVDPMDLRWDEPNGAAVRFGDLQYFEVFRMPALRDVVGLLRQRSVSPIRRLLETSNIPEPEKDALVQVLTDANQQIADQPTISAAGTRIQTGFRSTAGRAYPIGLRLGMADPSFSSITTGLNVLLTEGPLVDYEPRRNGLGLNNVLYVSMLLDYFDVVAAGADRAGHLLLVEEPEAHLHPLLQRVLYAALESRSSQVIMTTHSTHITSQAPLESIVALSRRGGGRSDASVPARSPGLTPAALRDIERYLDATRSVLLFGRKILLVEGAAEWFLIPPLVERVMGVDLDSEGIAIVPIFGRHFLSYTALFGEGGLSKPCAVLADRDLPPRAVPIDDGRLDDDLPPDPLDALAGVDVVGVFLGQTTFEREITAPGTVAMLRRACEMLGAPRLVRRLREAERDPAAADWEDLRDRVLRTADRFGKGRFAQAAALFVESAEEIPEYVREAITWLQNAD